AVRLDDLPRDVEAEPDPGALRAGDAEEALEHPVRVLRRDAGAGIPDLEPREPPLARGPQHDARAGRAVAERISDEVREHDRDAIRVGEHRQRAGALHVETDRSGPGGP